MTTAPGQAARRLQASSVLSFVAAAGCLFLLLSGWLFWASAQRALDDARIAARNLVNVIDRHATRTFDAVDVVIRTAAHTLPDSAAPLPWRNAEDDRLRGLLADIGQSMPFLQSLTVIDPESGVVRFHASISQSAVTDLPTLPPRLPARADGLTLGDAVFSATSHGWYLPVSRVMRAEGGRPISVIVMVALRHLQEGYDSLDIGPNGSITLMRSDAAMLLRRPFDSERINSDLSRSDLFSQHLPRAGHGDYHSASVIDGVERLFSYRKLEGAPVIAVVSLATRDVLARWFEGAAVDATLSLICLVLLAILGFSLARTMRERDASVTHFHATLNHLDLGLMIVGADQRVQFYNPKVTELLDLPAAFLDQKPDNAGMLAYQDSLGEFEHVSAPSRERMKASWTGVGESYVRQRPNGRFLEVRTVALPDGGIVRTFADVTERELSQKRLSDSEMLYRQLADALPQKVWIADADGNALYYNRQVFAYHGPVGPALADRVALNHPEDVSKLAAARDEAHAKGAPLQVEARVRRWDGAWRWHQIMMIPIQHDEAGKVQQWLGTSLDIHDIYSGLQKIKVTSSLLTLAQQAAGAGVWHWNAASGTAVHSPESARLHGWPCAEEEFIEVLAEDWSSCIHPEDVAAVWAGTRAAMETGVEYAVEFRLARPDEDGEHRWLLGCGRVVLDDHDKPSGIIGLNFDITERKRHAEQMRAARDAAERASLAKSQFLATMSHEIRTPLNAILGLASLALQGGEGSAALQRQIGLIEKAGSALLTIVNDVLDLSRIEAGKFEIEERRVNLEALAEDCIALTRGLAAQQGISLALTISPDFPEWLIADDTRIRQIVLNLLNNATKFTPQGSVTVALERDEDGICLSVIDTGIGIAPDQIPHLFQDFRQSDDIISRHYGGSGLGLSISRRLAEMMGGSISVESRVGEGSTFRLTLPLVEADADWYPAGSQPSSEMAATPRHVLLVDDVAINLEIVGQMLTTAGHSVEMAGSGPAAIAAFARGRHDIILMDVQMPGMDGIETTRRIRAGSPAGATVPIIALTANVFADQIGQCQGAGMSDHLGKPFRREALLGKVAQWTAGAASVAGTLSGLQREGGDHAAGVPDAVPLFDEAVLAELRHLLGADKSRDLLARFRDDLTTRLADPDPAGLKADAHALISSAGLLGFRRLSALARALEDAIGAVSASDPETTGALSAAQMQLLACRAETLDVVRAELDRAMSGMAPDAAARIATA
jgi:PAS domain S-box-containing protein